MPDINSENQNIRQFAERTAINMPIQGSAADLIKIAMININKGMNEARLKSEMILQVHDELVFDVLPGEEKFLTELIRDKMENAVKLKVPVEVSINAGKNWAQC